MAQFVLCRHCTVEGASVSDCCFRGYHVLLITRRHEHHRHIAYSDEQLQCWMPLSAHKNTASLSAICAFLGYSGRRAGALRACGVVVSHPLRMRRAMGSIPSKSICLLLPCVRGSIVALDFDLPWRCFKSLAVASSTEPDSPFQKYLATRNAGQ